MELKKYIITYIRYKKKNQFILLNASTTPVIPAVATAS